MTYVSFVWIFHQPRIQHDKVLRELHEDVYSPFMEVLQDFGKDIKPSFVVTGSFIDSYFTDCSETIEMLREAVISLNASVLPTLYYYPVPTEISHESFRKHLELHMNIMTSIFRKCSGVFYPPYLIWTPKYAKTLKSFGIVGSLVDSSAVLSRKIPVLIPWNGIKIVGLPVSEELSKRVPWDVDTIVESIKALEEYPKEPLIIIVRNVESVFVAGGKESSVSSLKDLFSKMLSLDDVELISIDDVFKVYRKAPEVPATYSTSEEFLKLTGGLGVKALYRSCASGPMLYRLKILQRAMEQTEVKDLIEIEDFYPMIRGRINPYYRARFLEEMAKKYSKFIIPYGVRAMSYKVKDSEFILYETKGLSAMINSSGYVISLMDLTHFFDFIATAVPESLEPSVDISDEEINSLPPHAFLEFIGEVPQIPHEHSIEMHVNKSEGTVDVQYSTRYVYVEKTYKVGGSTLSAEYYVKKSPQITDPLYVSFTTMLPVLEVGNPGDHRIVIGYSEKDFEILEVKKLSGAWSNYKWIGLVDFNSGLGVYFLAESSNGIHININLGRKGHDVMILPELSNTSHYRFKITLGVGKLLKGRDLKA